MTSDTLLPPGVAEAFGLSSDPAPKAPAQAPAAPPQAPAAPAAAAVAPVVEPPPQRPKKPRKKPQGRPRRRPARSEELDVVARETGPHRDLRGIVGFLTVDYDKNDRPYEVTFDPFDERIRNAVIPVHGWLESSERIHVTDDDSVRWRFDLTDTPEEYADEDEDEGDDDGED